jgi:hypothetical protein
VQSDDSALQTAALQRQTHTTCRSKALKLQEQQVSNLAPPFAMELSHTNYDRVCCPLGKTPLPNKKLPDVHAWQVTGRLFGVGMRM